MSLKSAWNVVKSPSHSVHPSHQNYYETGFTHVNQPAGVSLTAPCLMLPGPPGEHQPTPALLHSLQAWPRLRESSTWSRSQPLGSSIPSSLGSMAAACICQDIPTTLRHTHPAPTMAQECRPLQRCCWASVPQHGRKRRRVPRPITRRKSFPSRSVLSPPAHTDAHI